jgi:hypothetical protein
MAGASCVSVFAACGEPVERIGAGGWLGVLVMQFPRTSRADQPTERSAESDERTDSAIDVQTVTRTPFEKWEVDRTVPRERQIPGEVTSEEQ